MAVQAITIAFSRSRKAADAAKVRDSSALSSGVPPGLMFQLSLPSVRGGVQSLELG
jgi:hypothetical protein